MYCDCKLRIGCVRPPAFSEDRDLLEKFEAFGHPISIGAGQTIRADVTVVPQAPR